ncbi:MAG: hypothetical protein COA50_00385 [Flavobacteriaceae bacterium]|nr:MAG: hypothetical protein COA50_00385 [Flavobacteriaceae bacterium]
MKQGFIYFALLICFTSCNSNKKNTTPGDSIINPDKEEWVSLFNGKDLTGWDIKFANQELNVNYKNTIQVEDGMFRVVYDEYEEFNHDYGHIYYKQPFSYYKIRFAYRFTGEQTKGGATWNVRNSGIMFHSQSAASNSFGQGFPVSIELQLLGGLSDGEERHTGNLCTPGTAFEIEGAVNLSHCYDSSSKTYHGDQWVEVEAIVLGNESITHIVEKDTVLVFQKPHIGSENMADDLNSFGIDNQEEWMAKEGDMLSEGYIALQAESHPIDFKNIELLNLKGCTDPKAGNYKSYYVKTDNSSCTYD